MAVPRGKICFLINLSKLFLTFIANHFKGPLKGLMIRLGFKIGFGINSGNPQFFTKILQTNIPSVSFYKDVWCERKTL